MLYDLCIGIDYSGRETSASRTPALQVYTSRDRREPERLCPPPFDGKSYKNWNRKEVAAWLIEQARQGPPFIAGVDHGFSFPLSYFERYDLASWPAFLDDFCEHWPTDQEHTSVDEIRNSEQRPCQRTGVNREFRLTELWSSSAKSVFQFDVQGSVAKSTHAGLPWLRRIRDAVGDRVHFWPFDGWLPPDGKSVLAEVYPSVFRSRYPKGDRTADQQDAYSVARWLAESSGRGILGRYLDPPLTAEERRVAELEGWILAIS